MSDTFPVDPAFRIAALEARVRELEGERDRLRDLPEWIVRKLKTLGEYYEPPTDSRDVKGEIQGWMHVLCFHYVQNRREVKEYDAARRTAKAMTAERDATRAEAERLRGLVREAVAGLNAAWGLIDGFYPAHRRDYADLVARLGAE